MKLTTDTTLLEALVHSCIKGDCVSALATKEKQHIQENGFKRIRQAENTVSLEGGKWTHSCCPVASD